MLSWWDIYEVLEAMVPLYVPLGLGYASVKWWKIFTNEQCDGINKLVCYIILPLFTLEFTSHVDPFTINFRFIFSDAISKLIIVLILAFWANCSSKGSCSWSITSFSLSSLTNSLVVGVPLVKAMYGPMAVDLVIQSSVVQAIVWLTILLFVHEFRRSSIILSTNQSSIAENGRDLENNIDVRLSFWSSMKIAWFKLAKNPNFYACPVGLAWAFVSSWRHIQMPSVIEGSILIMPKAGAGLAMFNMGIFMALQENFFACGTTLTIVGIVLKFIAGPAAMAIGSFAVRLHGDVLRVAIIQAALPLSITSFIYAKEYDLHADVLSTAMIFGMIVSLPVLIGYYVVLELVH